MPKYTQQIAVTWGEHNSPERARQEVERRRPQNNTQEGGPEGTGAVNRTDNERKKNYSKQ